MSTDTQARADGGLQEFTARALARPAAQQAIEFQKRWIGWGDMRRVAERLAALIEASGAAAGAPIAFVPRNRPSAVAALLGLLARGSYLRMIYAFQSPAAIARDIDKLMPSVVVAAAEDFPEEVQAVLRANGIAGIALSEMDAAAVPGLEQSRRKHDDEASGYPRIEILTSGTTGPPKQFTVSYELIAKHHIGEMKDLSQETPALLCFPLGNITGVYSTLPPMVKGQRGILLDRFSVAGWHDYVKRFRPTMTGLPPAGVQMVLDANIPNEDLASIRYMGTGAAPLDPVVHRAFEERYGIPILLSYGATEFGGPVAAMTAELHAEWGQNKFGSVGRAMPGAALRVIDADTGAVLPQNHEGILEAVSPRIGPAWIRTSDIALIDEDGFLFHRGRADGAIMRGGFKLLPETIERALLLHPAVSAAAATGIPDHRLGQVPAVAVQLKPGVDAPGTADLEAHLRDHLPSTHIPVQWRFVETLPRTPSFKVDRPAVKALFAST
ncbi:MAG: AMP-dependent synthetase [Hydrocarboniphaga sp.]|uniref:class I adenylate-forming enzyme family protein n=1 Tax=Hydrocarboniphaga sp. TaxID=2033016 RepID=UPI002630563F|nr:fatty acid--CoA ligase family protein [Hydrocarboniphaga sp.]MDB5968711.1 AMP-dependent synthetase [Hydrocarboniphaga sp.]